MGEFLQFSSSSNKETEIRPENQGENHPRNKMESIEEMVTMLHAQAEMAEGKLNIIKIILDGVLQSIDDGETDIQLIRNHVESALDVVKN